METTRNDRMDVVECLVDEPRTNAHLTTKTKVSLSLTLSQLAQKRILLTSREEQ